MKSLNLNNMKTVKLIIVITTIGLMVLSCNKENPTNSSNPTGQSTIFYTDLSAEQDTISIGATTTVTATATGDGLTYNWSTDNGFIIGSGNQITYGASSCCSGTNTVTCNVIDSGNDQESKSITIVVQ